ncbi:hypothetical protein JHK87_031081 [Glycine soja]|nr:hypothetical protein JHK87_031081 [Glycine soja]
MLELLQSSSEMSTLLQISAFPLLVLEFPLHPSTKFPALDTFNDLEVTLRNSGDNDLEEHEFGNGFTPHYLAPSTIGPIVLKGVNYASGGGGIFVTIMISKLRVQLIRLFNLGGRKFVVANMGHKDRIKWGVHLVIKDVGLKYGGIRQFDRIASDSEISERLAWTPFTTGNRTRR